MKIFNLSILALRESFLTILPYTVLTAFLLLISQLCMFLGIDLLYVPSFFIEVFPLVLFTSIIYHFSIRHNVDFAIALVVSVSIVIFINTFLLGHDVNKMFHDSITIFMLLVPISTVLSLRAYHLISLNILFSSSDIRAILYSFIIFTKILILWSVFYIIGYKLFSFVWNLYSFNISSETVLILRTLFVQAFWFIGIHGENMYNMVTSNNIMQETFISGMSYQELLHYFVVAGGSGMILALIVVLLVTSSDEYSRKIAKLSIPFSLFNIGEVMIFGLPIVFNRYLLIPFIFIPIFNIFIVFILLSIFPIHIVHHNLSWSTPIFINIYYATDGDLSALLMQVGILILDILLYIPFVLRYTKTQSIQNHYKILENSLGINHAFNAKKGIELYKAKTSIMEENIKVESIINLLSENTLQIYFQPIVDSKQSKVSYYEALLRLKLDDGKVVGPYFLEDIEKAGLATIIDIWVVQEVKKHIDDSKGVLKDQININIYPDTLSDSEAMRKIIAIVDGENIAFEIIERELLHNKSAIKNIDLLKEYGFKIYIDDVGDGYSSYMMFSTLPIDAIKIDKQLIDIMDTKKGYKVIEHLYALSKSLGYECVAEGVEKKEQLYYLNKIGIRHIQGYYYSKALPVNEALVYIP